VGAPFEVSVPFPFKERIMKTRLTLASILAAAAVAAAANAEFYDGQEIAVSGFAYSSGPVGNTSWGFAAGQGTYDLGYTGNFFDSVYGPTYPVVVNSTVNNPYSVTFSIDFTGFFPGDFDLHVIEIVGLKSDFSIIGVQGNSQGFQTDGNNVVWQGSGAELASLGVLSFKVFQVPAPGAVALLGLAGLARNRRRA